MIKISKEGVFFSFNLDQKNLDILVGLRILTPLRESHDFSSLKVQTRKFLSIKRGKNKKFLFV